MTAQEVLIKLLARLAATSGSAVLVSADELESWPAAAVRALRSQRLLARTTPAASAICRGCEQQCVMPVHVVTRTDGHPCSFVVCDKRADINRVSVSSKSLEQWRCDSKALSTFISTRLGLRRDVSREVAGTSLLGIARGKKRSQMLGLQLHGQEWLLRAGDQTVPLADMLGYRDGEFSIDTVMVSDLADSTTSADPHYVPSIIKREAGKRRTKARRDAWRREYRRLKKLKPHKPDTWYAQQIAKLPIAAGRDAETIRKQLKA